MSDTTAVAFGELIMPLEPLQPDAVQASVWSSIALNGWCLVAAMIFIVLNIKNFCSMFPTLWAGIFNFKAYVILEDNLERVNTRNTLSLAFIFALCLIIDRFLMPQSHIASVFIMSASYWLYKLVLAKRLKAKRVDLNFVIVTVTALLVLWPFLGFCNASPGTCRKAVLITMGVFFFIQLLREYQFFRTIYPAFRTFLYLCALELLPIGILTLIWPQ